MLRGGGGIINFWAHDYRYFGVGCWSNIIDQLEARFYWGGFLTIGGKIITFLGQDFIGGDY